MALSNTATPKYYGMFRDAVIRGEIPVCEEISMEMNRIDTLIANPGVWYDDQAIRGFVEFCEKELTLTDGEDLHLLDSFKLWAEQIFGWYYFVERSIYEPNPDGHGGHYVTKTIKKRLINNFFKWLFGQRVPYIYFTVFVLMNRPIQISILRIRGHITRKHKRYTAINKISLFRRFNL